MGRSLVRVKIQNEEVVANWSSFSFNNQRWCKYSSRTFVAKHKRMANLDNPQFNQAIIIQAEYLDYQHNNNLLSQY